MNQTLPGLYCESEPFSTFRPRTYKKVPGVSPQQCIFQEAHLGTQKDIAQQRKLKASQINEASKLCR